MAGKYVGGIVEHTAGWRREGILSDTVVNGVRLANRQYQVLHGEAGPQPGWV